MQPVLIMHKILVISIILNVLVIGQVSNDTEVDQRMDSLYVVQIYNLIPARQLILFLIASR